MVEETLITQEMRDLLGKENPEGYFDVEKGHIKFFTDAIEDPNPLWTDLDYAGKSRYGTIIAPPTFLIDSGIMLLADRLIDMAENSGGSFINGGTEIEYFAPIKLGDTIKATVKLVDLKEKIGSSGKLLFMTLEMNYYNQGGQLARRCRNIFIQPQGKQE